MKKKKQNNFLEKYKTKIKLYFFFLYCFFIFNIIIKYYYNKLFTIHIFKPINEENYKKKIKI